MPASQQSFSSSPLAAATAPSSSLPAAVPGSHRPRPAATTSILPTSHWAEAPLPKDDDADSTLGSGTASPSVSITSGILTYRTINGRRYHAECGTAEYWACNDERHLQAMELHAHMCYLLLGKKLYKAPLEGANLKNALDVGTGIGVWAIDFADEFPECDVIGTDISPIQPTWVPPNVKFEIDDCNSEWGFAADTFDYVHIRLLHGSITDWDALFDRAWRVTKPGGWIESFEASPAARCDDGTMRPEGALAQWGRFFIEGGRKTNRTFEILENDLQTRAMERLGMEDVEVLNLKCPAGGWARDPNLKEIGRVCQATLEQDCEGYVSAMARIVSGWDGRDVAFYCAHMRAEVRSLRQHVYWNYRCVWGRKPGGGS